MGKIKQGLQRFMAGRYGNDQLNRLMLILTMVCFVVSMVSKLQIFYIVGIGLLVWSYVRCFSRNIQKRYAQNQIYVGMTSKVKGKFNLYKQHCRQRKTYRFFKCPGCRQKVRVPKGKGKISITCPSCKQEFIKRS
ncbi:MAG: hypothetical protein RR364_04445 [Lachnospiraceae bacterium]